MSTQCLLNPECGLDRNLRRLGEIEREKDDCLARLAELKLELLRMQPQCTVPGCTCHEEVRP